MVRALSRARGLFDGIPHRAAPRRGSAASPIAVGESGRGAEDALAGYVGMLVRGVGPDAYTFPTLLKAVTARSGAAPALGDAVQAHVIRFGLDLNAHVASSLIVMHAARGDGATARALLDACPVRDSPVMWNSLISGHNRSKQFRLSCCSFVDMDSAGVMPTPVTYISVLSACGKDKDMLLGMQVHKCVLESGVLPDLKVENALIDMYAECGDMDAAWDLFEGYGSEEYGVLDVGNFWVCEIRPG